MKTVLLDTVKWDLVLDVNGNIAVATEPYSLAQDAASAIKTFLGECWYNTTLGIDYFGLFLGKSPSIALLKAKMIGQALTVPGIVSAQVFITSFVGRRVTGQVQVTDEKGDVTAAAF
jgi:hypothetical protein